MSSWSQKRRMIYGGIVMTVVVGTISILGYSFFYKAPTCSDGVKNGDELGIDCGGSCVKMCASSFLPPKVSWTRFERITPNMINIASYVENLNVNGEAFNVPYHLELFDTKGILIVEFDGVFSMPPSRNALAFQGDVDIGSRIPAKAQMTITGIPDWHKREDPLALLIVMDKQYSEDGAGSSLIVKLKNTSARDIGKVSVYAILYDKSGNAIGFSKTMVDSIAAGGTVIAPFTWPVDHHGAVVSTEILRIAE
ncbi:MAG: FxLYD domain-containing protein [Candidatus Taylorbacteria bacterium]|nr:FxLYD domain-containing protein [Candidatus Taylorbacteria bacterium]